MRLLFLECFSLYFVALRWGFSILPLYSDTCCLFSLFSLFGLLFFLVFLSVFECFAAILNVFLMYCTVF